MAISPRLQHSLDQFIALQLDVQARLLSHQKSLIAAGWSQPEAWAWCQRTEERILGPAMDLTEIKVKLEDGAATLRDEIMERLEEALRRSERGESPAG